MTPDRQPVDEAVRAKLQEMCEALHEFAKEIGAEAAMIFVGITSQDGSIHSLGEMRSDTSEMRHLLEEHALEVIDPEAPELEPAEPASPSTH